MHFDCTIDRGTGAVLVTPFGEIDRDTAPYLRQRLAEAVALAGTGLVDVDLRHVMFMDSSGIGALLAAHRLAGESGAALRIRDPSPSVRTVLELTNVWDLLGA